MTNELRRIISHDDRWTMICYENDRCSGVIHIKTALYEMRKNKIDRLLKGLVYEILEGEDEL